MIEKLLHYLPEIKFSAPDRCKGKFPEHGVESVDAAMSSSSLPSLDSSRRLINPSHIIISNRWRKLIKEGRKYSRMHLAKDVWFKHYFMVNKSNANIINSIYKGHSYIRMDKEIRMAMLTMKITNRWRRLIKESELCETIADTNIIWQLKYDKHANKFKCNNK